MDETSAPGFFQTLLIVGILCIQTSPRPECPLPPLNNGQAACWKYRIVDVNITTTETYLFFKLINVTDPITRIVTQTTVSEVRTRKVVVETRKKCTMDLFPNMEFTMPQVYSIFIIDSPAEGDHYPNNYICRWRMFDFNDRLIEVKMLRQDIQGGLDNCTDRLTVNRPESFPELTTCGDNNAIPDGLNGKIYSGKIDLVFESDDKISGRGFRFIISAIRRSANRNKRELNPPETHKRVRCTCPTLPHSLEDMCSHESLMENKVYRMLMDGEGHNISYGFVGLRGCPGVDLFYTGQFQYPSEEECAKMTFGLSKNDISLFLQHKELKYAKEREVADFEDSYCSVQPMVPIEKRSPLAIEELVLEDMIENPDRTKANQYLKVWSYDLLLRVASELAKGGTLPSFTPV